MAELKVSSSNGLSFVNDISEIVKVGADAATSIGNAVNSFKTPKVTVMAPPTPTPDPRQAPTTLIPGVSNTTLMLVAGGLVVALFLLK